jgi:two-component system, LytTR family, response regulator
MKIDSIIIEPEPEVSALLKEYLNSQFSEIDVLAEATEFSMACSLIEEYNPALVFTDIRLCSKMKNVQAENPFEAVYSSTHVEDAISAFQHDACGFLLKPLNLSDVINSVSSVVRRVSEKRQPRLKAHHSENNLPHTRLIGIPTMEGMEFISANDIVRCEGLQKCTRIVALGKCSLISSYNIGEFRKLLEEYGFFSCHKSHLINLMHVKKITREGFVFLSDNAGVPLARRKRLDFLQLLKHP